MIEKYNFMNGLCYVARLGVSKLYSMFFELKIHTSYFTPFSPFFFLT